MNQRDIDSDLEFKKCHMCERDDGLTLCMYQYYLEAWFCVDCKEKR